MKQQDLQHFARILTREKERLLDDREAFGEEGMKKNESLRDSVSELSSYDNHPGDLGSENYEMTKDFILAERNKDLLEKVEQALSRIEEGSYGRCKRCGKEISLQRLEAVPYTAYCIKCRREVE